jgi:glycosyltransferase involved in cell wall biosynthesis
MLSIIIPTYNRGKSILGTLEPLRDQTSPLENYEVIVVDDASSDDTSSHVNEYLAKHSLHRWKCLRHTVNKGRAGALNTGIRSATTPIVAFSDDDIVPCHRWVEAHVTRHQIEARPVVVVGKLSYPDEWVAKSNLVRYRNSRYVGHRKCSAAAVGGTPLPAMLLSGGNSSLLRSVLLDVGIFDEHMRRGQDTELAARLEKCGVRVVYEPEAAVVHFAQAVWSYRDWFRAYQKFYIDCAPYMIKKHSDVYYRECHWFVEPPRLLREPLRFSLKKMFYRCIARPRLGKWLARVMESHDSNRRFYHPVIFMYMQLCAAIEAVNMRPDETVGESEQ